LLTATTTVFSIAAVAAAIPTETHKTLVLGILGALPTVERHASQPEAAPSRMAAAEGPASAKSRSYSTVEELPASGVLASRDLAEPHNPAEPLLTFTPRRPPLTAEEVVHTAFGAPLSQHIRSAIALARLPQAKPIAVWSMPESGPQPSPLLAYARAPSPIEEPFQVVLGLRRAVTEEADDGLYRPRPRPGAEVLSAWLGGRSPSQFTPGQHDWVQNPLPASVYSQKQQKCLAEGIYFESRGESEDGQAAVAQVILNRVRNPTYPDTICGVVYQNEKRRHKCQFSFACDGRAEIIKSQKNWKVAQRIGREVTDGTTWIDEVGDSTHYHANYVRPKWGRRMIKVDKIGAHIFYRTKFGGWS
jgi:hypothetical protein